MARTDGGAAAQAVGAWLDAVFAALEDAARATETTLASRAPTRADLGAVDTALIAALDRIGRGVDGVGVAFAPGALADAPAWLHWWRRDDAGRAEFARHVFDPESIRYYDYAAMDWFAVPAGEGRAAAVGPYVDSGGTDRSQVTLAVPCRAGGGTGVAAADVRLARLESAFRSALGTGTGGAGETVLVNDRDRIIATASARLLPGTFLTAPDAARAVRVPVASADPYRLPWQVATVPPR